jgi:hypothetical protein
MLKIASYCQGMNICCRYKDMHPRLKIGALKYHVGSNIKTLDSSHVSSVFSKKELLHGTHQSFTPKK